MNSLPAYLPENTVMTRIYDTTPSQKASICNDIYSFASRICSVSNTAIEMAAPICKNLCKIANKYPLAINLLAAGASLAIAPPALASLPFFVATGMMVAGCQSRNEKAA